MVNRDVAIDILRFIGLSLIILAHVSPPVVLLNLRCFDVPLMLFISGLVYSGKNIEIKPSFFVNRFLRLVVPVYIFLTIYFLVAFILKEFVSIDFGITQKHVIGSYLLMDGIGYVWIIRVFLLISLLTPLLIKINEKISRQYIFICLLFLMVILQEVVITNNIGMNIVLIREFIYYGFGYSILFLLGLRVKNVQNMKIWNIAGVLIFIITIVYLFVRASMSAIVPRFLDVISVNNYKYPPQMLFIAYGIMMSLLSYSLIRMMHIKKGISIFNFIGQNTIWIYLWHIPIVQLTGLLNISWLPRYFIVYMFAVIICYVQVSCVKIVQNKFSNFRLLKYLKG